MSYLEKISNQQGFAWTKDRPPSGLQEQTLSLSSHRMQAIKTLIQDSALYSRTSHSNKKVRTRTRTRKLNIETQTQVQVQLHKDNKSDNQSSITITKPKQEVTVMATRAEKSETEMKSVSSIFNAHMQLHTDHRMEPNPDHSPNWHQPCHSVLAYSMGWGFTPKSHSLFVE